MEMQRDAGRDSRARGRKAWRLCFGRLIAGMNAVTFESYVFRTHGKAIMCNLFDGSFNEGFISNFES